MIRVTHLTSDNTITDTGISFNEMFAAHCSMYWDIMLLVGGAPEKVMNSDTKSFAVSSSTWIVPSTPTWKQV